MNTLIRLITSHRPSKFKSKKNLIHSAFYIKDFILFSSFKVNACVKSSGLDVIQNPVVDASTEDNKA